MHKNRSHAAARLARLLAATPPPTDRAAEAVRRIDFTFPSAEDRQRLQDSQHR
ncbi:MAG: hypothetical protein KDB63_07445 [Nocardioidaceae bacterium]|nr:hypothetical protein [Nocardioidaceae bacterium]